MPTTSRDPKSIITPDAFSVHPPLLGTPLAAPSRRGMAVLIDLILVSFITAVTSGFWFVLGVVAAAFFFARATKPGQAQRASKMLRVLLGCMGVSVLSVTVIIFLAIRFVGQSGGVDAVVGDLEGLVETLNLPAEVVQVVEPEAGPEAEPQAGPQTEPQDVVDPQEQALAQAIELAGDTIRELEQGLAEANRDLEDTREELDEALQQRGLFRWLTSRIDSLGFGLGWWTLYFAILMPWMKGQTPGKRAMGVRVVRLDGQPVTWWHAFERAGGYAAGLATGTLGFLQIYWDANRQAIHDKVAGTVVVREGVPKVPGHWERLAEGSDF